MADAPTENHSQMAPTHPTSDESALSFSKALSRPSFPRFSVPPTQGGIWQVHQGDSYQVHQGGTCQVDEGGATQRREPLETWVCQYTVKSAEKWQRGGREVPALYYRCPVSLLSNCK